MILELLTIFAVLNATISNQEVPIEVAVSPVPTEGTATPATTTTNTGFDAAAITGIIAAIGGLLVAYKKNSTKVDAVADSTVNVHESQKASDYGNRDTADILSNALTKLQNIKTLEDIPKALSESVPAAQQNAKAWNKDVKEYYEIKPPTTSADLGLDKTRGKLVQVNKESKPTSESS